MCALIESCMLEIASGVWHTWETPAISTQDTRSDNTLVRQPTAGQNDRNIGQHPVTQIMDANERVEILYSRVSLPLLIFSPC
jgi:hypothetical protein